MTDPRSELRPSDRGRSPDLILDLWRSLSPMGDGKPCLSCGGNDGYGPSPHHKPDCYFASKEDADYGR